MQYIGSDSGHSSCVVVENLGRVLYILSYMCFVGLRVGAAAVTVVRDFVVSDFMCVCVLNHSKKEMEEEVRCGEGQGEIGKGGS